MLQNTKELYGNKIAALDGEVGRVKDFYFDDQTGTVRYLVADTGSWLRGRLVLLAPPVFGKLDQYENTLHIKLTKKQIEDSPPVDSHHWQSALALTGHAIQTVDGAIGHVSGLMVDDRSWTIRDLVVEAGHWYAGKQILISTIKLERISNAESKVYVNLTRADIRQTVENGAARAGGDNRGMEKLIG
jgi:sporulation protein YlmC with PRC-barrel domain